MRGAGRAVSGASSAPRSPRAPAGSKDDAPRTRSRSPTRRAATRWSTPWASGRRAVPRGGAPGADGPGGRGARPRGSVLGGPLAAVRRVLDGHRDRRPAVVAIEDLHWADPSSLELLDPLIAEMTPGGGL